MQALSELTDFVAKHQGSGAAGLHALAADLEALQGQELPQVQWRVAVLVERYYWSLSQSPGGQTQPQPRGATGRNLNSKASHPHQLSL